MYNKLMLISVFLLLLIPTAKALDLPQEIVFPNVLPGGFAEQTLLIGADGAAKTFVTISVAGPAQNWISVLPGKGYASKDSPLAVLVRVRPPPDTTPRQYSAQLTFDEPGQDSVTSYVGRPETEILIEVTDKAITQARAESIEIFLQDDKIVGLSHVRNMGNIRITPKLILGIGSSQANSKSIEILPTQTKVIRAELGTQGFEKKIQNVEAAIYLEDTLLKHETFPIDLAKTPEGKLSQINASGLEVGKPTVLNAVFQNSGQEEVTAQLKATVEHFGGSIYIESEKVAVRPGSSAELAASFTPQDSGQYAIKGYVVYGNYATEEKELVLSIAEAEVPLSFGIMPIVALAVIAIVLFFASQAKKRLPTRRRR